MKMLKKIAHPFVWVYTELVVFFGRRTEEFRFWRKKRKADRLHRITGKQYFVVPAGKHLAIINNDGIKAFNRRMKAEKKNPISYKQFCELAYYKTPVGCLGRKYQQPSLFRKILNRLKRKK